MKKALITGVTGQDGAYLPEFLLKKKDIKFMGLREGLLYLIRIELITYIKIPMKMIKIFSFTMVILTDSLNLTKVIQEVQPDEIYNLAAMSHVAVSFETPEYVANADGVGTLRLLEAIRLLGLTKKLRFIKQVLVNYMDWFNKFLKQKKLHSIHAALTQ